MENNLCVGVMGSLFGHRFRPVYDVKEGQGQMPDFSRISLDIAMASGQMEDVLHHLKTSDSRYVCSVCSRCGQVVHRLGGAD